MAASGVTVFEQNKEQLPQPKPPKDKVLLDERGLLDGLEGVIIQEMVKGSREMVCGIATDPQYGPMLMFGLGGLGSAFFGWLADKTSIEFIFRISTLLPLLGIITGFLPNIEGKTTNT